MLGGITASWIIARLREPTTMAAGLVLLGVGMGTAITRSTSAILAGAILTGLSIPWMMVSFATLRQRMTPGALQGKVSAATNMALNGPQTVGTALGAALITVVDYRILISAMALGVAGSAAPILSTRRPAPTAPAAGSTMSPR